MELNLLRGRHGQDGSLHVPLALAMLVIALAFLGAWGVLRHWRKTAELQLRLDHCVGRTAADLRQRLQKLEAGNQRIKSLRLTVRAAALIPPPAGETVKAGAKAALLAQVGLQEIRLLDWKRRQLMWIARRGCDGKRDLPHPLPALPWVRDPPDDLGPKPLRWPEGVPKTLGVHLSHSPRAASAAVRFRASAPLKEKKNENHRWQATWGLPGPGPDIR